MVAQPHSPSGNWIRWFLAVKFGISCHQFQRHPSECHHYRDPRRTKPRSQSSESSKREFFFAPCGEKYFRFTNFRVKDWRHGQSRPKPKLWGRSHIPCGSTPVVVSAVTWSQKQPAWSMLRRSYCYCCNSFIILCNGTYRLAVQNTIWIINRETVCIMEVSK